jgi:outer membrane immunogenic protein
MQKRISTAVILVALSVGAAHAEDDRAELAPLLKSSAKQDFKILDDSGLGDAERPKAAASRKQRKQTEERAAASAWRSTPVSSEEEAPGYIVRPPPPLPWTGFYIGLNAGGVFGQGQNIKTTALDAVDDPGFDPVDPFALSAMSSIRAGGGNGFIGGGQIGYNHQFGDFVIGAEADFHGTTLYGSGLAVGAGYDPSSGSAPLTVTTAQKSLQNLGTVRGRVGYLVTPTLLVYGTGGFAYGQTNLNVSITSNDMASVYGSALGTTSFLSIREGWAAGGGFEWMFWPGWSAKLDYLYYDLGTLSPGMDGIGNPHPGTVAGSSSGWAYLASTSTRFNGHIVRAGVNYHFSWGLPTLINPWR